MSLVWSRRILSVLTIIFAAVTLAAAQVNQFTVEQVRSYPFPNELTAAANGSRIAWASGRHQG